MTVENAVNVPCKVNDYVIILSESPQGERFTAYARVSSVREVEQATQRCTLATLEFAPNDRHNSPPDLVIPLVSQEGAYRLPAAVRSQKTGWVDTFREVPPQDLPCEIRRRFAAQSLV